MQHKRLQSSVLWLTAFSLFLLFSAKFGSAQGIATGGISGTVTDQTGAIIGGATVKAANEATGVTLQVTSDAEGTFEFHNVPVGSYAVTVTAAGFGPRTTNHVPVAAGNATPLGKIALKLGSASQTVEVEGGAAELINTETAQGGVVLDTAQLQTMPVNGGFDDVALVAPGVVMTHDDGFSNTNGVNFSANGERGRSNNFEIDGQSNNDNSVAGPSFFFSNQDAIQEVEVITNDFGAQYGRNMGTVVNYITKSGTNSFHGTGFEMYMGDWLSSLTQTEKDPQFGWCPPGEFAACTNPNNPNYATYGGLPIPSVPRFVQNNYGGTLGGPVMKDKLWLFGSTFWSHNYSSGAVITSGADTFPDSNGLSQLQSAFPNNPGVSALMLDGPFSTKIGNPTSFGPTSDINVTDGTTTASIETAAVRLALPSYTLDQEDLGRLDWQLTPKDRFFLRYNYQNNPTSPCCGNFVGAGWVNVYAITHEVGSDWVHSFTSRLSNQLRYSFQQSTIAFEGGANPGCTITSFNPCSSSVGLGTGLQGFGYSSNLPQGRIVKVNQLQDNASWTKGRHTVVFGGEFDHQNSPNTFLPNAAGVFNFAYGATTTPFNVPDTSYDNGITGLLEGISATDLTAGNPSIPFKEPDYAFYFQDDWKVMPSLTLNLGLRYEFFSQSVNLLHNETVAQQTSSKPFWDTSLPLSATTFPKINSDLRNIEPRVGFAFTPPGLSKMVVHGGFAMNADPEFYNIFLDAAIEAPVVNAGSFNCDGVSVQCVPAGGLDFATVQAADLQFIPTGSDPRAYPYVNLTVPTNFRNPMAETYTLGFQYQIFPAAVAEIRYVGNHTFDNFQAVNANPDVLDVQSSFPNYGSGVNACTDTSASGYTRPNCNYWLVLQDGNGAFSIYNGLQTSLTIRNFHNMTGTASYTYSRTIDNTSEIFSTGAGGNTSSIAQDPLNPNIGERGVSGTSYPNVWGLQLTYNTPWFRSQSGILGRLLGGYAMNAFYQFNGGQPFNPIQNSPTVQSPNVLADIASITDPTFNANAATTSFCDFVWSEVFGDPCRPVLSNKAAPMTSIGINLGPEGYVDYVSGNPTTRSSEHWIWNNQYEAMALGSPFPGVGRNTLRGDSFNNLDLSVGKNFRVTERVNLSLMANAFNILNRAYYGTPDVNIEDSLYPVLYGVPASFLSDYYAPGTTAESPAAGGAFGAGTGNRNIQLGGKVTF